MIVARLLFGTTNPGKLRELRRLVAGLRLEVVSPVDLGRELPSVTEDGRSFRENAEKKAVAHARASGLHALADDSGLSVEALYGLPGIRSARWAEEDESGEGGHAACDLPRVAEHELGPEVARAARDEANNRKLLRGLDGVPPELRGARYRAVLALAAPDGTVLATVEGECLGRIAEAPRGDGGFGYDPLFLPERYPDRTMAELTPEEKDAISHRGEALRRMLPELEKLASTL